MLLAPDTDPEQPSPINADPDPQHWKIGKEEMYPKVFISNVMAKLGSPDPDQH